MSPQPRTSDIYSDVKQFENGRCDYCVVKITMQIGLNLSTYTCRLHLSVGQSV